LRPDRKRLEPLKQRLLRDAKVQEGDSLGDDSVALLV
jgi:hypothetical protein